MVLRLTAAAAATIALLAGCSKAPEPAAEAAAADELAAPAEAAAPVFARTPAPAGAVAYIVSPANGATVSSPVKVVFGLSGMGVAPAGVQFENAGHHHLLIDGELADPAMPVPADENHVHFGKGQTETSLTLAPGTHTLQLVLGDHLHVPFEPVIASSKITITVK
jgi:hypothetical protein